MSEYEAYERGVSAGLGWALAGGPQRAPEPENPYANYQAALQAVLAACAKVNAKPDPDGERKVNTAVVLAAIDRHVHIEALNA